MGDNFNLTKTGVQQTNGQTQYQDSPEQTMSMANEQLANSKTPFVLNASATDPRDVLSGGDYNNAPSVVKPSFKQATQDQNGMTRPLNTSETKVGKLFHILGAVAKGAADGIGGNNFGEGFQRAQQMPFVRARQNQQLQQEGLQNQMYQAQLQNVPFMRQQQQLGIQETQARIAKLKAEAEAKQVDPTPTLQQLYAAAVQDAVKNGRKPESDPVATQYADAITSLQKQTAPKEQNRDDKAIAIEQKRSQGIPLSPEEVSYDAAYKKWVKENKVDPGVARMQILLQRPYEAADPNNPGETIIVPGNKAPGMKGKSSSSVVTPKAMDKYMTSGKGGQTVNAFNTAISHLDTLKRLAIGLDNGNVQVVNKIGNEWAKQTGNPAPVTFEAAKAAVSGEIAAAFKSSGATDQEIAAITNTFANYQSTQQLLGGIATYTELLNSKRDSMKSQYQAGRSGKADFRDEQPGVAKNPYR